jgi:hypothetical protein
MEEQSKNARNIIISNFNICKYIDSTTIGVFIGITTGVVVEILIDKNFSCGSLIFVSCCLLSTLALWVANKKDREFDNHCKNLVVSDPKNEFATYDAVINHIKEKERDTYKPIKRWYYGSLCFVILFLIVGGVCFFVLN